MNDINHTPQLERTLLLQRASFQRDGAPSLAQRRADLKKLRRAILDQRDEIAEAISADFGHRSRHETAIMELLTLVMGIDYLYKNLRRFMRPTRRHVAMTMRLGSAHIEYQPLGVVGIMAPWNYPFSLAAMPLATALAAGNRAMIKPSEFTPATSALLAKLLAGLFPEEQVALVQGDASLGAAFSSLPFDHLVFTGSTPVGRAVMKAASEHLVPLTLELGGKSPAIVARAHHLGRAAMGIAYGKLANAGQTCVAPDYALIPEQELERFVAAFDESVRALYPDGPASTDYTSIINERHHTRLGGLIEDARARGARILEVGENPADAARRPHTLAPTLILDVTDDMKIMQDEIFGPILPIKTYRSLDEAIDYVNANPRPLALYYFGRDDGDRRKVLSRTTSGNVTINATLTHYAQEDLPFGGVGPSGMGAYHGIEGFRALSHAKGVFEQGRLNGADLLRAPFGRLANWILGFLLR
ncbi:coniferyl aldehyde dehydrogenase [Pseudomonas aeruginosa]|uniref:coniferyl aldehyde dehydrogenase n=1 Tax=Pseudomonas aeruginosa TaxID=287 RepID=UPI003A4E47E5